MTRKTKNILFIMFDQLRFDYEVMAMMERRLYDWGRRLSQRTTLSEHDAAQMRGGSRRKGIMLGMFDEGDAPAELTAKFKGAVTQRFVD